MHKFRRKSEPLPALRYAGNNGRACIGHAGGLAVEEKGGLLWLHLAGGWLMMAQVGDWIVFDASGPQVFRPHDFAEQFERAA